MTHLKILFDLIKVTYNCNIYRRIFIIFKINKFTDKVRRIIFFSLFCVILPQSNVNNSYMVKTVLVIFVLIYQTLSEKFQITKYNIFCNT
jgi:hypothetical protein